MHPRRNDEIRILSRERYIRTPRPLSLSSPLSSSCSIHLVYPSLSLPSFALTHKLSSKCLRPPLLKSLPASATTGASSSPSRLATPVTSVSFRTALLSMWLLESPDFVQTRVLTSYAVSAPRLPARTLPTLSLPPTLPRLRSLLTKYASGNEGYGTLIKPSIKLKYSKLRREQL